MTQEKLSELLSCEPNHVAKIEAGIHFPQPEKLEILANAFDVKMSELFNYEHKISENDLKDKIIEWLNSANLSDLEFIYKTINNLSIIKK